MGGGSAAARPPGGRETAEEAARDDAQGKDAVADRKGKNGRWFLFGLIFGIFALIKLVRSPSEPEKKESPGTAHLYLGKRPQFSTPSDARRWLTDQEEARRNRVRAGGRGDGE